MAIQIKLDDRQQTLVQEALEFMEESYDRATSDMDKKDLPDHYVLLNDYRNLILLVRGQ